MVNGVPVKTEAWQWSSILTFSRNVNKLDDLSNVEFTETSYDIGWLGGDFPLNCQRIVEGEPLGTFYGPVWLELTNTATIYSRMQTRSEKSTLKTGKRLATHTRSAFSDGATQ